MLAEARVPFPVYVASRLRSAATTCCRCTYHPLQSAWLPRRRFSQQIRLVLGKPDGLAEARSLCAAQMDEAHALLADDTAFRTEYMRLWEGQRKHPISPFSVRLLSCSLHVESDTTYE